MHAAVTHIYSPLRRIISPLGSVEQSWRESPHEFRWTSPLTIKERHEIELPWTELECGDTTSSLLYIGFSIPNLSQLETWYSVLLFRYFSPMITNHEIALHDLINLKTSRIAKFFFFFYQYRLLTRLIIEVIPLLRYRSNFEDSVLQTL